MNIGSGQTITVNAVIDQLSEVAEAQLEVDRNPTQ